MIHILPELVFPLVNAEDIYLNCCAFFSEQTNTVAYVPFCEYVYNSGIGVSGDGIKAAENLLYEYQFFKKKALDLAKVHGAGERPIYLCNRETLRFLDCLINEYILRGDDKERVCERILGWWSYEFIQAAKVYFKDYMKTQKLDQEMMTFSIENNPECYYEYCLGRMGNLKTERLKYNIKRFIKTNLRIIDKFS